MTKHNEAYIKYFFYKKQELSWNQSGSAAGKWNILYISINFIGS